jgi:hypothetical protein
VSGKGQWLMLADQAALHGFSIGDIFLIAGFLTFLIARVQRLHKEGSIVANSD